MTDKTFTFQAEAGESHTVPFRAPGNADEMAFAGRWRRSCLSNWCRGQRHAGWAVRRRDEGITEDITLAGSEVSPELCAACKHVTEMFL